MGIAKQKCAYCGTRDQLFNCINCGGPIPEYHYQGDTFTRAVMRELEQINKDGQRDLARILRLHGSA